MTDDLNTLRDQLQSPPTPDAAGKHRYLNIRPPSTTADWPVV